MALCEMKCAPHSKLMKRRGLFMGGLKPAAGKQTTNPARCYQSRRAARCEPTGTMEPSGERPGVNRPLPSSHPASGPVSTGRYHQAIRRAARCEPAGTIKPSGERPGVNRPVPSSHPASGPVSTGRYHQAIRRAARCQPAVTIKQSGERPGVNRPVPSSHPASGPV